LPTGVIAFPAVDGTSITTTSYTVVVRTDANVSEVAYSIKDTNGVVTGLAQSVAPDGTLSQQYTNYPQEFRFAYSPVASSGTGTITVQLRTPSSNVLTNRITTLIRTITPRAPGSSVQIVNPPTDGAVLLLNSNAVYTVQACLSTNLVTDTSLYSLYINGVLQPRANYIIRGVGSVGGCPGTRSLSYSWNLPPSGTNVLQLFYTNGITLGDTRTVAVARIGDPSDSDGDGAPDWMEILAGTNPYDPNDFFRITGLVAGNPVELSWSSVPGRNYQVLATTNWIYPLATIPGAFVPAEPATNVTRWFDATPDATNRFYRVQVLQ
jgi:hypothetical protein